jgi:kinesin family protein C2/C3
MEYSIKVQMLEIYNEQLRDLLVRPSGQNAPPKLDILNTLASGCNVRNAEQVAVSSSASVMNLMDRGSRNRHVAQTDMNERSSRSHQVMMGR